MRKYSSSQKQSMQSQSQPHQSSHHQLQSQPQPQPQPYPKNPNLPKPQLNPQPHPPPSSSNHGWGSYSYPYPLPYSQLHHCSQKKLLQSPKFTYSPTFKPKINIQVLDTNFQSLKVMLHYGHYRLEVSVIYTEIDQRVFEEGQEEDGRGSFGVVRFGEIGGKRYAVKGVGFRCKDVEVDVQNVYKEYFLCCMADVLEVGPQVFSLFGYDILLTKRMAFFAMQQCEYIKQQSLQSLQSDLSQNLQILHSLNIIHLDIKPANIAYSQNLQKHVFIDFGLSKIIQQKPGQKTETKFTGSLPFCSEEMKMCYILMTSRLVDLYGNDLCCLGRSLKMVYKLNFQENFKFDGNIDGNFNGNRSGNYGKIGVVDGGTRGTRDTGDTGDVGEGKELTIFKEIVLVLRLKYFIEMEDVGECLKILSEHPNKTLIYQILQTTNLPTTLTSNTQIQQHLSTIKSKLFPSQSCPTPSLPNNPILSNFFSQHNKQICAQKIIPIHQILESKPSLFNLYLSNTNLLLKLFHFIEPPSYTASVRMERMERKEGLFGGDRSALKRDIIGRIYEMEERKVGKKGRKVFFAEKVRFVLEFFYWGLRGLGNFRVMTSLRLLFLSVEQLTYFSKVEDDIIEMINEPFLKMLKIAEFSLFWDMLLKEFQHQRKEKWLQIVRSLRKDINQGSRQHQIHQFILQVLPQTKHFSHTSHQKLSTISKILQISTYCKSEPQTQTITNIKSIYIFLSQFHKHSHDPKLHTFAISPVYEKYPEYLQYQVSGREGEEERIFWSVRLEYNWVLLRDGDEGEKGEKGEGKELGEMVRNQVEIYMEREEEDMIAVIGYIVIFSELDRKYLDYFVEKMEKFVKEKPPTASNIYTLFLSIDYYFQYLHKIQSQHQPQSSPEHPPNSLTLPSTPIPCPNLTKLQKILNTLTQNPLSQKILNESLQLRIDLMIIRVKFCFERGESLAEMEGRVREIFGILEPIFYQFSSLVVHFLTLYGYFREYLEKDGENYVKSMILRIGEAYMTQNWFGFFYKRKPVLGDTIRMKNQKGQEKQTFEAILSLEPHFSLKNQQGDFWKINIEIFLFANTAFCSSLLPQKILDFYTSIRYNQNQFKSSLYAYFVFTTFFPIKSHLPPSHKHRQILRTTLTLKNMPWICQSTLKYALFPLYNSLIQFKNKRRELIFQRWGLRYADFGEGKVGVGRIRGRVDRIRDRDRDRRRDGREGRDWEERRDEILGKLGEKVGRLAKLWM